MATGWTNRLPRCLSALTLILLLWGILEAAEPGLEEEQRKQKALV